MVAAREVPNGPTTGHIGYRGGHGRRRITCVPGRRHYLWRAVDQDGNVLDIL